MVYIVSWDEFVERSVQLFRADLESTRYVMKYRHYDGKLVLKVTDNKECLKFKTDQAQDVKKMEKLNNIFFALMARGLEVDITEVTGNDQMEAQPSKKGRGRKQYEHGFWAWRSTMVVMWVDSLYSVVIGKGKNKGEPLDPLVLDCKGAALM